MSCPMSGRVSFLNFNPARVRRRGRRGWRCGGRSEHAADDFAFFPNRAVALSHFFLLWFLPRSIVLPAFPLIACRIDKITPRKKCRVYSLVDRGGSLSETNMELFFRDNCKSSTVNILYENGKKYIFLYTFFWNHRKLFVLCLRKLVMSRSWRCVLLKIFFSLTLNVFVIKIFKICRGNVRSKLSCNS